MNLHLAENEVRASGNYIEDAIRLVYLRHFSDEHPLVIDTKRHPIAVIYIMFAIRRLLNHRLCVNS